MLDILPQGADAAHMGLRFADRSFATPGPSAKRSLQDSELGLIIPQQLNVFQRTRGANGSQ